MFVSIVSRRRGGGGVVVLNSKLLQIRVLGGRVVNNRHGSRAIGVSAGGSELVAKGTRLANLREGRLKGTDYFLGSSLQTHTSSC
jgi:hypothetical protein